MRNNTTFEVDDFVNQLKRLLELSYPDVWVEGEVASVSIPASGHCYFSLQGKKNTLRCVLFKNKRYLAATAPEIGKALRVRGKVSMYAQRSDVQLIANYIEDADAAEQLRQFELIKRKLAKEGLFDASEKKDLPDLPLSIAFIGSSHGAAIHDVLSTLNQRAPYVHVTVYPCLVQGDKAAKQITQQLVLADDPQQHDLIILARGGGATEDLNAYNDETLARTIASCHTPVITGIGHEVDFTIADLVADFRAPTPTGAAINAVKSRQEMQQECHGLQNKLQHAAQAHINKLRQNVDYSARQLISPQQRITQLKHRKDLAQFSLQQRVQQRLQANHHQVARLAASLKLHNPSQQTKAQRHRVQLLGQQLRKNTQKQFTEKRKRVAIAHEKLQILSHQTTLNRGYALLQKTSGEVIADLNTLQQCDAVQARLKDGKTTLAIQTIPPKS